MITDAVRQGRLTRMIVDDDFVPWGDLNLLIVTAKRRPTEGSDFMGEWITELRDFSPFVLATSTHGDEAHAGALNWFRDVAVSRFNALVSKETVPCADYIIRLRLENPQGSVSATEAIDIPGPDWSKWHELRRKKREGLLTAQESAEYERLSCLARESDARYLALQERALQPALVRHEQMIASMEKIADSVRALLEKGSAHRKSGQ